ncbi:DUF3298 and DUF4163 domain-containing protein [Candidatus Gracilibacteria bacterium]|nr:DUF3298 and DUF4163 domain-containing protein [Candidatus Gracilibacteria bacterium]MCF7819360.1 DUF3298 and DUF4163 domain-containing protein [Candidatus Gracilibacteria bacterium]
MKKFLLGFSVFFLVGCGQQQENSLSENSEQEKPPVQVEEDAMVITDDPQEESPTLIEQPLPESEEEIDDDYSGELPDTESDPYAFLPSDIENKSQEEETDVYSIDLNYPFWIHESYTKLNEAIAALMAEEKKAFTETDFYTEEDSAAREKYILQNSYALATNSPEMISIRFDFGTYTGGAHGMSYTQTLNYNPAKKELFSIDDLISRYPNILQTASQECQEQVTEALGDMAEEELIAEGLASEKENFEAFYFLGERAIEFIFDPYHVAPYSAGSQSCQLMLEELR